MDTIISTMLLFQKYGSKEQVKSFVIDENVFNLRTVYSRIRTLDAIQASFMGTISPGNSDFVSKFLALENGKSFRKLFLFLQFGSLNSLFYRLTFGYLLQNLKSGKLVYSTDDIYSELLEIQSESPEELPFSESTLRVTAYKYLTLLAKFGLFTGRQKKSFVLPTISLQEFCFIVLFLHNLGVKDDDIFSSQWLSLYTQSEAEKFRLCQEAAVHNYIGFSRLGNRVTIIPLISLEEFFDTIRIGN
ncbi:MAG: hypothetical protein P4L45_15405 [Ignavibacteriaceae bacterium]|nr:hypothetical protein [Ignavibacteriaceae bacterium]